jgi:DNA polymerase III gamma/tau subunit
MTLSDSNSQAGSAGNTNSAASAQQNVQPSSETVTITKAQWDTVEQKLQKLESGYQSDKDRAVKNTNERLNKLEGDIRPLLERALQHTASGKTAVEALNLVQSEQEETVTKQALAEFAQAWRSGKLPDGFGAGNAQAQGVDVGAVLAEYGLDPKDSYVAGKLAGQTFTSKEQAELYAARIFRDKALNLTNPAQQSAITSGVTGAADPSGDFVRLEELYKNYTQNQHEISAIEGRLRASGAIK